MGVLFNCHRGPPRMITWGKYVNMRISSVAIGLDALNFMLALLLVTLGLVVIFGLMNVINMAHGEFFLIGAYCVVMVERAGYTFGRALLLSPLVLAIIGLALEELVVRHTYR